MTETVQALRALLTTPVLPGPEAPLREWIGTGLDRSSMLSSGERVIFDVALAVWNGNRTARVADLFNTLDDHSFAAVMAILRDARCAAA